MRTDFSSLVGVLSISCKLQTKPSIHGVLGKDLFCCSRSCAGCFFLFGQSTHRQEVFTDIDEIALRWNDLRGQYFPYIVFDYFAGNSDSFQFNATVQYF